ncbi:MAG: hypothetical protein ACK4PI_00980 [Tepidisphaerales bacterium]
MRKVMGVLAAAAAAGMVSLATGAGSAWAGPLGNSSLVVLRFGTGTAASISGAVPTFLDEYTVDLNPATSLPAVPRQTIALPTSGPQAIVLASGVSRSHALSRSVNGQYLTFGAYNAPVGSGNPASNAANARIAVRVGLDGSVDGSTNIASPIAGTQPIRHAVSVDGSSFYASFDNAAQQPGVVLASYGPQTISSVRTTISIRESQMSGVRNLAISSSALFAFSGTGSGGIYAFSPLPTTLQDPPPVIAYSDRSFTTGVLVDVDGDGGNDLLYTIGNDDQINAGRDTLFKFAFVGGTWVERGLTLIPAATSGVTNRSFVDVVVSGGASVLFVSNETGIYRLTESDAVNGSLVEAALTSATPYISAASNTRFRGFAAIPEPAMLGLLGPAFALLLRRRG